ncbi:MAG: ATP-binding cassette domain-containing protein [Saprospiraceae bacterium]|nr:ATP-binding cassette domain-containing protein [Saprospiraceae bacterium]
MRKLNLELNAADIYAGQYLILDNISLKLQEEEIIYLCGSPNSGMQSLLRTLWTEFPLRKGHLKILDSEPKSLDADSLAALRQRFGIVSQTLPLLDNLSIEENLLFILEYTNEFNLQTRIERTNEVISLFGLEQWRQQHPAQLSHFELIKAQIARALLNHPSILFLDDPLLLLKDSQREQLMYCIHNQLNQIVSSILIGSSVYDYLERYPAPTWQIQEGRLNRLDLELTKQSPSALDIDSGHV